MSGQVLALSGGVGGARMAHGLSMAMTDPTQLTVCCNVGDDFDHLGLRVCADTDTVLYTMSGLSDPVRGWGVIDETWSFMDAMKRVGGETWFLLGDRDLATHVWRTDQIAKGRTLGDLTAELAHNLGIKARIVPVSDDPVATIVETPEGPLAFQHYFVREQCRPHLTGLQFKGAESARLSPVIARLLSNNTLDGVVICPSNPFLSIDPMLAIPSLRSALETRRVPCIAVSPIIGGQAVKGPLAKIMAENGLEVSALGIARLYQGLIDGFMIDEADRELAASIEALGIKVSVSGTLMKSDDDRRTLGANALDFLKQVKNEAG